MMPLKGSLGEGVGGGASCSSTAMATNMSTVVTSSTAAELATEELEQIVRETRVRCGTVLICRMGAPCRRLKFSVLCINELLLSLRPVSTACAWELRSYSIE
jgi:hypothetical protein